MQKRKSKSNNKQVQRLGRIPRQVNSTIRKRMVLRWTTSADVNTNITYADIGDIIAVGASSNSLTQLFNDVVKIHRVSIYGAPSSTGVATSCSVEFNNQNAGYVGENFNYTDTTLGQSQGPVVHAYPNTLTGQYQISNANISAFNLQCKSGSMVELDFTGVISTSGDNKACQNTTSITAVVGTVYQRGLDGISVASSQFTSVGWLQA